MSIFDQVFGEHVNSIVFYHVNGMSRVDEKNGVLSFKISPTYKADYVEIASNKDDTFNVTLFKQSEPYRFFKAVERSNVINVLEIGTDVMFG